MPPSPCTVAVGPPPGIWRSAGQQQVDPTASQPPAPHCISPFLSTHQVLDGVRAIIPLWGAKLVVPVHDHPQHQHLLAVPEGR